VQSDSDDYGRSDGEDTKGPGFHRSPQDLTLECGDAGNEAAVQAGWPARPLRDDCGAVEVTNDFAGIPTVATRSR